MKMKIANVPWEDSQLNLMSQIGFPLTINLKDLYKPHAIFLRAVMSHEIRSVGTRRRGNKAQFY